MEERKACSYVLGCTLPRKRRRWIGVVVRCPQCKTMYSLVRRAYLYYGSFLMWERIDGQS